jgi:hypothetical protein
VVEHREGEPEPPVPRCGRREVVAVLPALASFRGAGRLAPPPEIVGEGAAPWAPFVGRHKWTSPNWPRLCGGASTLLDVAWIGVAGAAPRAYGSESLFIILPASVVRAALLLEDGLLHSHPWVITPVQKHARGNF